MSASIIKTQRSSSGCLKITIEQSIYSSTTINDVDTRSARNRVIPITTIENVITISARNRVIPSTAIESIIPITTDQVIVILSASNLKVLNPCKGYLVVTSVSIR